MDGESETRTPTRGDGIDPHRLAEVIVVAGDGSARRGSGYRVTGRAVLTAAHVIAGARSVCVRFDADAPEADER